MSIFGGLRRKEKKDLCSSCRWYYPENGTCQIKKCAGRGGPGYVTRWDRKHCGGFEPKPLAKVTNVEKTDGGLRVEAKLHDDANETLNRIRAGDGLDPLPNQAEEDSGLITLYADNVAVEVLTPNEHRAVRGCKPVWKGPLPEPRIEEYGTIEHWDGKTITKLKRCEYCGCFSDLVKGTCEHCGAPL